MTKVLVRGGNLLPLAHVETGDREHGMEERSVGHREVAGRWGRGLPAKKLRARL
jgi:hypothetical protein